MRKLKNQDKLICVARNHPATRTPQAYLSMFLQDGPKEAEGVGEALGARTLPNADHTSLFWMQHSALRKDGEKTLKTGWRTSCISVLCRLSWLPLYTLQQSTMHKVKWMRDRGLGNVCG